MAISTFHKQFRLTDEKADEFFAEMTREIKPTLPTDFQSQLKSEKDLRPLLQKAL